MPNFDQRLFFEITRAPAGSMAAVFHQTAAKMCQTVAGRLRPNPKGFRQTSYY
jgi:hypothetical protein